LKRRRGLVSKRALPYVLSLPALLVCIGILIPFFTAAFYSLQRFRLSQPWARKMNWGENYLNFITDPGFWNTVKVSLSYATLTVGLELLFGLGIALLLRKRTRINNFVSILLLMPLMTAFPEYGAFYCGTCRYLGVHAIYYDSAAGGVTVSADTTL